MLKSSALGGFACACLLFAAALSVAAVGLPYWPDLSGGPFALMSGVLLLGACAGPFAVLAMGLGACSFRSPWGMVGAVGGALLLVSDAVYLLWAFSLG